MSQIVFSEGIQTILFLNALRGNVSLSLMVKIPRMSEIVFTPRSLSSLVNFEFGQPEEVICGSLQDYGLLTT